MISVLILTHNRPELFKRCLLSVLKIVPTNVEILVNNDSNDIDEISHPQVKYSYYQNNDLSQVYKYLFDKAIGEYIYFLEDDDYMNKLFFEKIDRQYDINYFYFISSDIKDTYKMLNNFELPSENTLFQLSQILFKKSLVKTFPEGNYLDNDWKLFQHIKNDSIKLIKYPAFTQTSDAKDNISFEEYNIDERFKRN